MIDASLACTLICLACAGVSAAAATYAGRAVITLRRLRTEVVEAMAETMSDAIDEELRRIDELDRSRRRD